MSVCLREEQLSETVDVQPRNGHLIYFTPQKFFSEITSF